MLIWRVWKSCLKQVLRKMSDVFVLLLLDVEGDEVDVSRKFTMDLYLRRRVPRVS